MNNTINFYWVPPSRCESWAAWRWGGWDIHKGWDDAWTQIREVGIRILGVEISWEELRGSTKI